jgi:hypothetical protein
VAAGAAAPPLPLHCGAAARAAGLLRMLARLADQAEPQAGPLAAGSKRRAEASDAELRAAKRGRFGDEASMRAELVSFLRAQGARPGVSVEPRDSLSGAAGDGCWTTRSARGRPGRR